MISILPLLFLYSIFASTLSIGKLALVFGPPALFVGLRMVIAGIALLSLAAYRFGMQGLLVKRQDFSTFFLMAFVGIFLVYVPDFWALPHVPIVSAALLYALAPFFSALLGHFKEVEVITKTKLLGLIIGFAGLLPIIVQSCRSEGITQCLQFGFYELVILISVAFYAYNWLLVKPLMRAGVYSNEIINGWPMLFGGILSLVWSYAVEGPTYFSMPVASAWAPFLAYALLICVVGTSCYVFYSSLLKKYSATLIAFFGFTEPLFGAAYGYIFNHETPHFVFFIASVIICIGLYLFYQDELKESLT